MAGLTSWQAFFDHGQLAAQDTILIHGAAGAIGSFAVQLALGTGAFVITTSSADNIDFINDFGANKIIDYKV